MEEKKKKTNKLQVHPYKSVSWSPTHQGIDDDEWATTIQACRDELVVYLSFSSIYTTLYFYVLSTVLRKSSFTLYIYIYISRMIKIEYPKVMPLARRIQKDTKRLDSDELIGRMKK